jgi:ADP-dependent phosphofructokinase/glucokinase
MVHVIFEYAAGTCVEAGRERAAAPEANRIIVSYDPVNNELEFDPLYADAVADPAAQAGAVLLSGYNQVSTIDLCRQRIAETVALLRRWKAARPRLLAHLELGGTPDEEYLAAILDGFAGEVDSVGLNADELNDVLRLWGRGHTANTADLVAAAQEMYFRLGCGRLNVHTQNLCVTISHGDPQEEQDALLCGSLVAGTRARLAAFPQHGDLARVLAECAVAPAGLHMLSGALAAWGCPAEGIARLDGAWLVVAPTLAVANPAGLVGLGDSFTAGVLGILAAGCA